MAVSSFDWKLLAAVAGTVIGNGSFLPYYWAVFKGKTKPHVYTWLIWTLTQATAAVGIWYGHGGIIAYGFVLGTLQCFLVFLLSFRYGTKNITASDSLTLIGAFAAILVWWQLKQPVLAVLMVTVIDAAGYYPTFRKSYFEPWSENVGSWAGFFIGPVFALLALQAYNILTVTYIAMVAVANISLAFLCLARRRTVAKPI